MIRNIAIGKPTAADDEVIAAVKAAYTHDFIMEFPQGYNNFHSGALMQLSGGQMQRIFIARSIIKEPSVLLLDDSNSEKPVQEAIRNIRKPKQIT